MKVAILTSSRADYGIYAPLLKAFKEDSFFNLSIIAFGTHLSIAHSHTIEQIFNDEYFNEVIEVDTMPAGDSPFSISECMGKTIINFATVWRTHNFDLVFCLGDRYEMFAACASTLPFNIKLAHISGGEQTLGAIDDSFRHAITHMSTFHFTSTEQYKKRVIELKGNDQFVYNTGALNIDNLTRISFLSIERFKEQYNIDLEIPSILITFHPETIYVGGNKDYILELIGALEQITNYQLIITMPNADTFGQLIREQLVKFISNNKNAIGVESFGSVGYLSCMKHCSFLLGNTSSGFVEASYFSKYVINLGKRQEGRILTPNIRNCKIEKNEILRAVNEFQPSLPYSQANLYGTGNAANKIIEILKIEF